MASAGLDRSMHGSLREEIQQLRKKVVTLETAEADNEKLRKELSKLQNSVADEKAQLELDFLNQLTAVGRENALRLEEMEGRLNESNKVNRALSEQLQHTESPEEVKKRIEASESSHRKELVEVIDKNKAEVEKLQKQRDQLTEKLDAAKVDLELKQSEVGSLELKVKTLSNSSASNIPKSSANGSLQKMLKDAHAENAKLKSTVRSLENDLSKKPDLLKNKNTTSVEDRTTLALKELEKENSNLRNSSQKSERERKQLEVQVEQLENAHNQSKVTCKRLETENEELKKAVDKTSRASSSVEPRAIVEAIETMPSQDADASQPKSFQKRTSQIIQQLEQNLKREGQMKQSITADLKWKRRSEADVVAGSPRASPRFSPRVSDNSKATEVLQTEVHELKQKLDKERDLTASLKREIQNAKSTQKQSPISKIPQYIVAAPTQQKDRASLAARKASLSVPSPRTPVKAIAQSFERRISQDALRRGLDFHPAFETDDIEELREAFQVERDNALDLEDELTRQCEINCSLLKEISFLTSETETSRDKHAQNFANSMTDQKEMDKLSAEISTLKSQLSQAEEEKATLSQNVESNLSRQYEMAASSDRSEIDRLKLKIRQIQEKLDNTEEAMKKLEAKSRSDSIELKRRQKLIDEFDTTYRREIETFNSKAQELENELQKYKDRSSGHDPTRDDEIAGLNSLVEALQNNLTDADETKVALEKQKEEASRLNVLVQDLKEQVAESEKRCDMLSTDSSQILVDKDEIENLKAQVDSLVAELDRVTEHRDELETKDVQNREKFEALQKKVDEKVEEFEMTHNGDKEAIGRLHDQVHSLQEELQETLDTVENLNSKLKEKEEAEETVEELARKNQQSLDSQMNKLQTELTKNHVAETEYKKKIQSYEEMIASMQVEMDESLSVKDKEIEGIKRTEDANKVLAERLTREKEQLVLSMNDMASSRRDEIDELQTELMEMSTRAANQAREVQTVKLQLEESSYRKDEVERLRTRVRELGDQLAARDGGRMNERAELEVENSELRQRLRQHSVERQEAEEKLRDFVKDKGGSSRSVQVLRERNAVLKFEVEKLTKKLRKFSERTKTTPTNANTVAERFVI